MSLGFLFYFLIFHFLLAKVRCERSVKYGSDVLWFKRYLNKRIPNLQFSKRTDDKYKQPNICVDLLTKLATETQVKDLVFNHSKCLLANKLNLPIIFYFRNTKWNVSLSIMLHEYMSLVKT